MLSIQSKPSFQPYFLIGFECALVAQLNLLDRSILAQVVGQFHVLVKLVAETVIKPEDLDQSCTNGH